MYVKIHEQIFSSSIMEEELEIRYVWFCLLTLADKEGFIDMTVNSIARRINIDEEIVNRSIEKFMEPDHSSRTQSEDGRRLEKVRDSFGWRIINYIHYRDLRNEQSRREYMKNYMRLKRSVNKKVNTDVNSKQCKPELANTDTSTDTIKKENTLSCREEGSRPPEKSDFKIKAKEILGFLNEKTKRQYRPVEANIGLIIARLHSGVDVQDFKCVIAKKTREWLTDPKMLTYLRPKTLFNKINFEQYLGELEQETHQ